MDENIPENVVREFEERLDSWFSEDKPSWLRALRQLNEQAFLVNWKEHLSRLNSDRKFTGTSQLSLQRDDLPPAWFNGNVEALVPGSWILFASLNPQIPGGKEKEQIDGLEPTPDAWWQFWLRHNETNWYEGFSWRPVKVASIALTGEEVLGDERKQFATKQMVFVEACPYPSSAFPFAGASLGRLSIQDLGLIVERQVIELLLQAGPAAVLVNGNPAIEFFEGYCWPDRARWGDVTYELPDNPTKHLWHREGSLTIPRRNSAVEVPLVGFPFLGGPKTHNSHAEVAELGKRVRDFIHRA